MGLMKHCCCFCVCAGFIILIKFLGARQDGEVYSRGASAYYGLQAQHP